MALGEWTELEISDHLHPELSDIACQASLGHSMLHLAMIGSDGAVATDMTTFRYTPDIMKIELSGRHYSSYY